MFSVTGLRRETCYGSARGVFSICVLKQARMVPMKILVYGAGVVGTLYAARLQEAGHQVTVLARNSRLADVRRHGLVLEDVVTGVRSVTHISIVDRLYAEDSYDIALVAVRKDQLSAVMPDLASNTGIPTVLFMLNNPLGSAKLVNALGPGRVLLGFPGAGGELQGHIVRYAMIAQQRTTVGEPTGMQTARPQALVKVLRAAGFRTRTDSDMDAWLSAHAFFVTSASGAIYLAGGDCVQLSRNQPLLKLMVQGTREGFNAVSALGRPVHPLALSFLFTRLPAQVTVYYWRHFFSNPMAEYVFARHARGASVEMRTLAAECRVLLARSSVLAPALNELYCAIDEYAAAHAHPAPPAANPIESSSRKIGC
jgi:2-dehydropantoate 2-reductase